MSHAILPQGRHRRDQNAARDADTQGRIVTIDAIGCQMEIVRKILERGGDHLLPAKDNQPHRVQALQAFLDEGEVFGFGRWVDSRHETVEKERDWNWRIENNLLDTDVTFREDDCRVRKGRAPRNYSTLRQFALALLCNDTLTPGVQLKVEGKTSACASSFPSIFRAR
jgi:predicted transposase YbfD/YdcC